MTALRRPLVALGAILALGLGAAVAPVGAPDVVDAAPAGDDEVVGFVVRGVGNGHGRGMSQWGAYGRAVHGAQNWQDILASYYGGTVPGSIAPGQTIRVRLNAMADIGTVGVMSTVGAARWRAGGGWSSPTGSIYVDDVGSNRFDVYTSPDVSCSTSVPDGPLAIGAQGDDVRRVQSFLLSDGFSPGPVDGDFGPMTKAAVEAFQTDSGLDVDGRWEFAEAEEARARIAAGGAGPAWTKVASSLAGPIEFSMSGTPANPGAALGLCQPSGTVIHYRGTIRVFDTEAVGNRTVNEVAVEDYLRGVVSKEVSPSWGDDNGFAGMNALRAQAVAARSYGVSQNRGYWVDHAKTRRYATTCDSPSCQVYGGAAKRTFPGSTVYSPVEHEYTDDAIADTAGVIREWSDGTVVSTEFSASNGPQTAGGSFPSVADPLDDVSGNPNHRWTRIIDADSIRSRYGLSSANGVRTQVDADSPYESIWANEVRLASGSTVSAWDFRNAYGLPAPGFELIPIRRDVSGAASFAFIGDSVGSGVVGSCCGAWFRDLTEGVFATESYDAAVGRRTQGGSGTDGVEAAAEVPIGTDLVVVELGYNDDPASMPARIDALMSALRDRDVGRVAWVNVSERSSSRDYAATNAALEAATDRWSELVVLDWEAASGGSVPNSDRWFASDGVHLTTTGNAEFALWLRDRTVDLVADGYTPPRPLVPGVPLRVPVVGVAGVPESGVAGVSLNVTAVDPVDRGWLRVWACGGEEPVTASVNYPAGGVVPNAVVLPVDGSGEVCVSSRVETDVVVDVMGWFDGGLRSLQPDRLVDTRIGLGPTPPS